MEHKRLKVTWEINDGYAGGSRPQYLTVEPDDLEGCDTPGDIEDCVVDLIMDKLCDMGMSITKIKEVD